MGFLSATVHGTVLDMEFCSLLGHVNNYPFCDTAFLKDASRCKLNVLISLFPHIVAKN